MEEKKGLIGKTWESLKKHKIIYSLILLAILGGSYYWYITKKSTNQEATTYKTETVEKGDLSVLVSGSGQIEPKSQVDLKGVVAGDAIEVVAVYVKNDQEVVKNQKIALLDSGDAQKSIRNAELNLESAKVKYASVKRSYDRDQVSKYDKETQKLAVEQAENSLQDAKENLEDYYITAPFDGVVTDLAVEAGDSISQSDILASVITKEMVANITLNEVDAAKVKVGNKATLTFDALSDLTVSGTVSKVDTIGTVESGVVSYGIEIEFESSSEYLKPGMSANAEIEIESKSDILTISSSAIKTNGDKKYVLVVSVNSSQTASETQGITSAQPMLSQFQRKEIVTGISNDTQTEIVSGLSEGDVVVISSSASTTTSKSSSGATTSSSGSILPTMSGGGPGSGGGPRK